MATTYEIVGTFVKKVNGVTQSTRAISHTTELADDAAAPPTAPTIDTFYVTPSTIQEGESATLVWTTTGSVNVTLDGVAVAPDGQQQITPADDDTFTLSATNAQGTVTADTTVVVTDAPTGEPVANDIVDDNGVVVQSLYNDMAYNYADPAKGIPYRFGAPATSTLAPTLQTRADLGSILYGSGHRIYHQFGAENNQLINDFVTSNGCALYRPLVGTSVAGSIGRFCTYQIDRHAISQRPQLMWQNPNLLAPQLSDYINQNIVSTSTPADLPVCQFRAQLGADAGPDRMSLVATQGSPTRGPRIICIGTETAQQRGSVEFPAGKVITAISVTNGGEYGFAAIWDTVNFKGQIAIISIGSVPMGCTWQNPTNPPWYDWWHDWQDMVHPGLRNKGGWAFLKIIGYLDLPSNMKAPTSIFANTGMTHIEPLYEGLDPSSSMKLSSPLANNRARLLPGGDFYRFHAKGGVVVVASQSEKTVCFIDLAPLFTYYTGMYLNSSASNLETQNVGMGPTQWPYMIADHPEAMPTIIKTVTLPAAPVGIAGTCTYNYWSKDNTRREPGTPGYPMAAPRYPRTWVVTRTGTCYIYSMGRWMPGGLPPDQTPAASEIAQIGTVTGLGEQITSVNRVKDFDIDLQGVTYHPDDGIPIGCLDEMMMVVDRKNRRINWVQFTVTTGDGGSVVDSLSDSRMDPIAADHVDGYYKSNKVILVADYSGHRVLNYRVSNGTPLTYDGTAYPTLDTSGEFCGSLALPGAPFSAVTSNSP